jgi:hypothetical protein
VVVGIANVTSTNISTTLKAAVTFLGPTLGFHAADGVSARSLPWPCFVPTLLDTDIFRLLAGRWRSDEIMICYLDVQAEPTMCGFSARMLQHGSFILLPNNDAPASNFPPSEFPSMSHVSCPHVSCPTMVAMLPSQSTMVPI